jgi:hypothetical protein
MKRTIACACARSQRRNSCCCKRRFDESLENTRALLDDCEKLDNLQVLLQADSPSPALTLALDLLADHLRVLVRTRLVAAIAAERRALADYLCCCGGDR